MGLLRRLTWPALRWFGDGVPAARRLGVSVGEQCRIYSGRFGSEPWLVSLGDRVIVSFGVSFVTHDASTALFRDDRGRRYLFKRVSVGSDVFIGANAIILPGVQIGSRVIVGAGSVVTRSIPDNAVVAGNPARFVRSFDSLEAEALVTLPAELDRKGATFKEHVDSLLMEGWRAPLEGGSLD